MRDAIALPHVEQGIYHYSDESSLNTVHVCLPKGDDSSPPRETQLWVIYIHGGAWRDPAIDASSFDKLQTKLLHSQDGIRHISGLASINYRLSPYPSHRTDPSNPADPARSAHHPDHINDVLAAILYLQEKYDFEHRYMLVGHSCGATLAFQVAMKRYWGKQYESTFATELNVVPPVAIMGVEGIYDVPLLLTKYKDEPAYFDFIANAFGSDAATWSAASPAKAIYEDNWQEGRYIGLVHSRSDELVGVDQRDIMAEALLSEDWSSAGERHLQIHDVQGLQHDELWQHPDTLANIITEAIVSCVARL